MRLFIQLENGQPKAWPLIGDNVKYLAPPGVGFPSTAAAYEEVDLAEFGFETFIDVASPAFEPITHKLVDATPVKVGGEWTRQWQVVALTPEEAAAASQQHALQVQTATVAAIQNLLDATAREHGYDDLRSTISYVGSAIPKWHNEATRAKAWRDECWWAAFQIQEAVKAGTRPLPTVEAVLAEMPPANWPAA